MWKQQIKQRLDASVEEILGIFEQTVAEYKQELSRLKSGEWQKQTLTYFYLCNLPTAFRCVLSPENCEDVGYSLGTDFRWLMALASCSLSC